MLGNLFILLILVLILAFVIGVIDDDWINLRYVLLSFFDPEHRKYRQLYQLTRR